MSDRTLALLNSYEVVVDGVHRHVVCFLDPVRAGALGIDARSVIGEFTPRPDGSFDRATFRINPEFIAAFTRYMNDEAARSPDVRRGAQAYPSGWLYVVDPRAPQTPDDPPASDVLGCFAVDDTGQIAPGSFQYNQNHDWFDPDRGLSGLLSDRRFYDWLHPAPEGSP